jgi:hypothetical protein
VEEELKLHDADILLPLLVDPKCQLMRGFRREVKDTSLSRDL